MKKFCGKIISVILSLLLVLSAFTICMPSFAADNGAGTNIPLIYVVGQGTPLYTSDESGSWTRIYPVDVPTELIATTAKENIDVFAKAVFTQDWTDFGEIVRGVLDRTYGHLALDENGKTTDNSFSYPNWRIKGIDAGTVDNQYPTERFSYFYDFRLDPYVIADDLHDYIEAVMAATGADRVALLGRCLGGCMTAAYMEKYNGEYVSDFIQYCTALEGATVCSKLFAGDIYLDADGIERFVYDIELSAEKVTNDLIQSFVTLFNDTYGLDLACWSVNNVWDNIYHDILPNALLDTFGTWPGYWSMVSDEDYIRAKDNIFYNADMDKWGGFVNMIDDYHYNVQVKVPENFARYQKMGIDIFNVAKYGFQQAPLNAPGDMMSDSFCSLEHSSFGATVATLTSTFDKNYIKNATANGLEKYISPDKQVDASTCLLPDRTWFIKNLGHKDFPVEINRLFNYMVNIDGFNVETNENYPQYLVKDSSGSIVPMTAENQNTTQRYFHTFFEALKTFFESLFAVIKSKITAQTQA